VGYCYEGEVDEEGRKKKRERKRERERERERRERCKFSYARIGNRAFYFRPAALINRTEREKKKKKKKKEKKGKWELLIYYSEQAESHSLVPIAQSNKRKLSRIARADEKRVIRLLSIRLDLLAA